MLESFAHWVTRDILYIKDGTLASEAVSYFIYDSIKIFLLLAVIIFLISLIRTYIPAEKIRNILSRKKRLAGHVSAAAFGILTPFCTCSAIPLFLGFIEAGIPLGVTFTFLVASPMINEVAIVMLFGLFGWKVTVLYIFSGMLIAILSGLFIGGLKPEKLLHKDFSAKASKEKTSAHFKGLKGRLVYAKDYMLEIIRKVWLFILIGIGLGAWIHGYVPADMLAAIAGKDNFFAVPIATLIGIPLYSNAAGILPLVDALTEKGMAMGTVLAFMMAVTALSLPEFLILRRIMKTRLILIFAATVGTGIIFTGYLFNAVL
jgi:uncharacterized membrane protein YraQ (UPF0718 family)